MENKSQFDNDLFLNIPFDENKCHECGRIILFKCICKCKGIFCIDCRMPEYHKCTFDFKSIPIKSYDKVIPEKIKKL